MSDFEGWAIVEQFGHRRAAGRVREVMFLGAPMLRLDIPIDSERFLKPRLVSPQSLYQVTMVDEEEARRVAAWAHPQTELQLPPVRAPEIEQEEEPESEGEDGEEEGDGDDIPFDGAPTLQEDDDLAKEQPS